MKDDANSCDHAIGTAKIEYSREVVHVSDDANDADWFSAYEFCPYCGKNIETEAQTFRDAVFKHWQAFWAGYQAQHGEEECRRAMKSSFVSYDHYFSQP